MYRGYREDPPPTQVRGRPPTIPVVRRIALAALIALCVSSVLVGGYVWLSQRPPARPPATRATTTTTTTTNGATRWVGDTQTTAPTFAAPASTTALAVDALFQKYYTSNAVAQQLGAPLTPAFPIRQGWMQFFAAGALLLPAKDQDGSSAAGDNEINELMSVGLVDKDTDVVRLPLHQALLTVGSQARVGGQSSSLTYVDLRRATDPAQMVPNNGASVPSTASQNSGGQGDVFIAGGARDGKTVGHIVPGVIWSYISRSNVSPDGWMNDFGAPLTEALPLTLTVQGSTHHLLIQVFWRNVVLVDQGVPGASSPPAFLSLETGLDYLRTLGPPQVVVGQHTSVWALGDTALKSAAGSGQETVHVGQQFPLTLVGSASWVQGALWYQVRWQAPHTSGEGWADAAALTFTSPGSVPGWASFDVLSPDLAAYLASEGGTVAAVAYDETRGRYYTYNLAGRYITGSSIKVTIMLTFLNKIEQEGRQPTSVELCLLTHMIENSDNDAASAFYYGQPYALCGTTNFEPIGGAAGITRYLNQIGVSGLVPDPNHWGYSMIAPLVMVHILTLLHDGKILTPQDRALALSLMEHLEPDQRFGVGDSAPAGATVAMKNGWLPGPDGLWAVNSSGIVTLGGETYILSIYTNEHTSFQAGIDILDHVGSAVAAALD